MTLKTLMQGPLPVTAPLVLNPLMAKMVEASGFSAGYLGGGATGYLKVVLEANLHVSEKGQAALVLLSMARTPEQLRLIAERLGAPLMYLTGRGGLAALGMSLKDLGALGYRIVADPSTPLWAGYAAWKKVYADLADDFGAKAQKTDWTAVEHEVLGVIDIEKLLAVERATVEH